MLNQAYNQYQSNSILTATSAELTLMLYNGAIKFCNQAKDAIENTDIPKSNIALLRAQDIIVELQATLDEQYPIAKEMDALYEFIKQCLMEANVEKDTKKIDDALYLIREFKDAWQQIMKQTK